MRRTDRELTGISELRAILDQCDAMRIAGQDAEGFFIFPVNGGYTVEGDKLTLYFHSATEGRKARAFAQGCEIAFEMDCGHKLRTADTACGHSFTYRSVMGTGQVVPLASPEEKRTGLMAVMAHATGRDDWDFPDASLQKTAVYRLCVRTWSAKANLGG